MKSGKDQYEKIPYRKIHLTVLVIFCFLRAALFSQENNHDSKAFEIQTVSIVVIPFMRMEGSAHIPLLASRLTEKRIAMSLNYEVFPQSQIDTQLEKSGSVLSVKSCDNSGCALEIAQTLGVQYAFMGMVYEESNVITIHGRLVDAADGNVLLETGKRVYDARDINIAAELFSREISAVLFPGKTRSALLTEPVVDVFSDSLDIRKYPDEGKDNAGGIKDGPVQGKQKLDIEPEKDRSGVLADAAFISGLCFINAANIFFGLEDAYRTDYRLRMEEYTNAINPQESINVWELARESKKSARYLQWSGIAGQSVGLGLGMTALWTGDDSVLSMSRNRRILFVAGMIIQTGSGIFDTLAARAFCDSAISYSDYRYANTQGDIERFWSSYEADFHNYQSLSFCSWALKGSAIALQATMLIWKGKDPQPLVSGFWDRIFYSAGMLSWGAGNILNRYVMENQRKMLWAKHEYSGFAEGTLEYEDAYGEYLQTESRYKTAQIAACSVWGLGAVFLITAATVDIPDPGFIKRKKSGEIISFLEVSIIPVADSILLAGRLRL